MDIQKASQNYEKASSQHQAAKETVELAQKSYHSLGEDGKQKEAWSEMMTHSQLKVVSMLRNPEALC